MFHSTGSSSHATLSPQKALDLTNVYLENARKVNDPQLALELCRDAETSLSQVMKMDLNPPRDTQDQPLRERVASSCFELGQLQDHLGSGDKAQASYKKAGKLGWHAQNQSTRPLQRPNPNSNSNNILHPMDNQKPSAQDKTGTEQGLDIATIPAHIFSENKSPPAAA
ncbi:hypothetical protein BGZ65_007425, partial [Modicella reniformis]